MKGMCEDHKTDLGSPLGGGSGEDTGKGEDLQLPGHIIDVVRAPYRGGRTPPASGFTQKNTGPPVPQQGQRHYIPPTATCRMRAISSPPGRR